MSFSLSLGQEEEEKEEEEKEEEEGGTHMVLADKLDGVSRYAPPPPTMLFCFYVQCTLLSKPRRPLTNCKRQRPRNVFLSCQRAIRKYAGNRVLSLDFEFPGHLRGNRRGRRFFDQDSRLFGGGELPPRQGVPKVRRLRAGEDGQVCSMQMSNLLP